MSALVQLSHVSRSFGDATILDRLNLSFDAGEFIVLLGRSGSGKSTLLRLLAGLDQATTGDVRSPSERAVVFQEPRLIPWMTASRNVSFGLHVPDAQARAEAVLAEVGLSHRTEAWPLTLSGGEAQRTALARALVRQPKLLLMDEPFAALDALTRLRMQELVETLWLTHRPAVLLVTHDVEEALLLADRILVLADGRIELDIPVALARPRGPEDPDFPRLRRELLQHLGVHLGARRAA